MKKEDFLEFDKKIITKNKLIHQIWFGLFPSKKQASIDYKKMEKYRNTWLERNKDWERIEWNLEMCYHLIKEFFPEHYKTFKTYKYHIQRCDFIRYCILYRYSGFYVDMDYICNCNLNEILKKYNGDIYLVQTPNSYFFQEKDYISNSLMYSKTNNNPFWKILMIELEKHSSPPSYYSRHLYIMYSTGPGILNRIYNKYKYLYKVKSFPYLNFQPYGIKDDIRSINLPNHIYMCHLNYGSWEESDSKFFISFVREWKILIFIFLVIIIFWLLSIKIF
jgi:mannosyltransferase OCH1-like enzyme